MPRLNMEDTTLSVIRTKELLAYSDNSPESKQGVREEQALKNVRLWQDRHPYLLTQLDPWLFYAKNIRTDEPNLQTFAEKATTIQSAEDQATILLRLRCGDDDARMELTCDKAADCVPTKYRLGTFRNGLWITWADELCEWRKTGDVWLPAHIVSIGYVGKNERPVKFVDLTVRNVGVNGDAVMPDSVFESVSIRSRADGVR
jgi:hypothetical protein